MHRVLLIHPPIEDFFFTPARSFPLGLLSLATVLTQAGVHARILNCPAFPGRKTVRLPPELTPLQKYYRQNLSPFCLFHEYFRFGADYELIRRELCEYQPHIVGICLNFTPYLDTGVGVAELVKQVDPRITVVAGGRAATAQPALVMRHAAFDYLIRGESEFSLRDLCLALQQGRKPRPDIPGLCSRRADGTVRISRTPAVIPDLNALPLPDYRLLDLTPYRFQGRPLASLLASRGCALGCAFCAIQERFRFRAVPGVREEMAQGFFRGIRHFNFEDDTVNLHPQFDRLLDGIREHFHGRVRISFMNGLLSRGLNRRLVAKLARAGLTHADLSVGSTVGRLRAAMHRRETPAAVASAAALFRQAGIPVTIHFIIGYPGQSFADVVRDIRILARQPVMLGPSIFYPVPASPVFPKIAAGYRAAKSYRLMRSSAASYTRDIPRERLMTLLYLSRVVNAIKESLDRTGKGPEGPEWEALFKRQRICRVVRGREGRSQLMLEEFVKSADVKIILGDLEVCGLKGEKFRVLI